MRGRRAGRATSFVTIALAAVMLSPSTASASTATYTPGVPEWWDPCGYWVVDRVDYVASPGEINRLSILDATTEVLVGSPFEGPPCGDLHATLGKVVLQEGAAHIAASEPCRNHRPRAVVCPPGDIYVDLGDREDALVVSAGLRPVHVDAGTGDDALRVANGVADVLVCGPGTDSVVADASDAVDGSCESVIRV